MNLQRRSDRFTIKYLSLKFVIIFLIASTFVTRGSAITILDDHVSFTLEETTSCCVSIEGFQSLLGTIGGVRLFQVLVLQNIESNNFKKLEVQLHCFSVLRQDPLPFPSTVNVTTSWNLRIAFDTYCTYFNNLTIFKIKWKKAKLARTSLPIFFCNFCLNKWNSTTMTTTIQKDRDRGWWAFCQGRDQ